MEAARSFKSLEFAFEIWERESAPAELMPDVPAIERRLTEFVLYSEDGRHQDFFLTHSAIGPSRELPCIKYQPRGCQDLSAKKINAH